MHPWMNPWTWPWPWSAWAWFGPAWISGLVAVFGAKPSSSLASCGTLLVWYGLTPLSKAWGCWFLAMAAHLRLMNL
jgi:hypothetical protein